MKRIAGIALLLCTIIFLFSCSKGAEECTKCGIMPVDKVLNVTIGHSDKTFNLWKNDGRNNTNNYCIVDAKSAVSSAEILSGMETLNLNGVHDMTEGSLISVAYFVNKDLSKVSHYTLNASDLLGYFVYYESDKKMYVRVFEKIDSSYKEIPELYSEMDFITSNNLATFAQLFFDNGATSVSAILNSDISKIHERSSKDRFSRKLYKYVFKGAALRPTIGFPNQEHNGGSRCDKPCLMGGSLTCQQRPTWSCKGISDCGKSKALQPYNSYAEGNDPRDPVLYQFRDGFMGKSSVGRHYIDDFYYIGGILKGNLNPQIAAESFRVMDAYVLPIISKFMKNPESSEILYDQNAKTALIAYVNNVRKLSDDPIFLEMMGEVQGTLEYCAGKTIKSINSEVMSN